MKLRVIRWLSLARRYIKALILALWTFYIGWALLSGRIEVSAAFEKLFSAEVLTAVFGV